MGGHVADDVLLERSIEAFRTCVRRIETFSTVLHPQEQIGRSGYGWSVQSYDPRVLYALLVCDTWIWCRVLLLVRIHAVQHIA